jgi:hypothetical protein
MGDDSLRGVWCDGFVPRRYIFDDQRPRIVGRAWICRGPRQAEWEFILLLPSPVGSWDEIDWASLLPQENVTRWLSLNQDRRCIEIEPGVAVPDPC